MKKRCKIFVCAMLLCTLFGCSKETPPSAVSEKFLEAFKAQSQEDMNTMVSSTITENTFLNFDSINLSKLPDTQKSTFEAILKKMSEVSYKVKEETIQGDKATITLTIETYNFGEQFKLGFQQAIMQALGSAMDESKTEEDRNNELFETLFASLNKAEKTYKKDISVHLVKLEDEWKIDSENNSELYDALSGGMLAVGNSIREYFGN